MKKICILGSTGSIGTQALDVIRRNPDKFEAHTLTAGNNADLLIEQAREFKPDTVVIANEEKFDYIKEALSDTARKVYAGNAALEEVVENDSIDTVLASMVGFAGLRPTVRAIKASKEIAIANKETLFVAGELIMPLAKKHNARMLPVDSEHSAILQCLMGEFPNKIEKILLTASGGPFRTFSSDQMANVTAAQALKHPNWEMGAKITIDSATMMNKGFEMIEACWLFGVKPNDIQVVVHPESIIHSAVQFEDGAVIAQMGLPDMRLPIQYAFAFPQRLKVDSKRLDLFSLGQLNFEKPNFERFPCLSLAYEAAEQGGNIPCAMNAANEIANLAFREEKIGFLKIADVIRRTMQEISFIAKPTLEDYFATDETARRIASKYITN